MVADIVGQARRSRVVDTFDVVYNAQIGTANRLYTRSPIYPFAASSVQKTRRLQL